LQISSSPIAISASASGLRRADPNVAATIFEGFTSALSAASAASPAASVAQFADPRLGADTAIALQLAEAEQPLEKSATEKFLDYARMSPSERLRDDVLKSLGLTEEDLEAMPTEERRAAEDKIRELIEEKIRQANGAETRGSTDRESARGVPIDILA